MVKHAAKEEEPIFTAEERVDNALKKVMSGKSFNDEQRNWLGLIRQHLITNLTILWFFLCVIETSWQTGGKASSPQSSPIHWTTTTVSF